MRNPASRQSNLTAIIAMITITAIIVNWSQINIYDTTDDNSEILWDALSFSEILPAGSRVSPIFGRNFGSEQK